MGYQDPWMLKAVLDEKNTQGWQVTAA